MEQPATLRVVSAGKVVEAQSMPSGIPGLALVGHPVATGWRLVHVASGRAVSRSAEHSDPEAVRSLAKAVAPLADWTQPNVAVAVPRLREQLDQALATWRAAHPDSSRPRPSPTLVERPAPRLTSTNGSTGGDLEKELDDLVKRLRGAENERVMLREVVRRLHSAMAPNDFAEALENLSQSDRERVHGLVKERSAPDITAVVKAIRPDGQTTSRVPNRPRSPGVPGPDVAAS